MELYLMTGASVVIVALLLKNYQKLALISLDKDTAKVAGLQVERWELVFNIILAVAVVLGIKVLGVVLVSALLVIPIAISKMLSKSFKKLMISSVVVSELVVLIGIFLSYHWDLPTGPVIVLFGTVLLGVVALLRR